MNCQVILQRVGSLQALQHLCVKFDARLAKMLPVYWDLMTSSLLKITAPLGKCFSMYLYMQMSNQIMSTVLSTVA